MRLLDVRTYSLHVCFEPNIPYYAILSHRWEEDEVLLTDLGQDDYTRKKGLNKIKFTCEQAYEDGLLYCWIDTCCIDKTSSAESSEAIHSMFRWYEESHVCYAYLADVGVTGCKIESSGVLLSGRFDETAMGSAPIRDQKYRDLLASSWFECGWTDKEYCLDKNNIRWGIHAYDHERFHAATQFAHEFRRIYRTSDDRHFLRLTPELHGFFEYATAK